ncbi:hypothetical protein ABK040_010680 [Willaertia magna]
MIEFTTLSPTANNNTTQITKYKRIEHPSFSNHPYTSLEEITSSYRWFSNQRIDYHTYRFSDALQKQLSNKNKETIQTLLDILRLKYIFPYSRLLAIFTYFYIQTIKYLFK